MRISILFRDSMSSNILVSAFSMIATQPSFYTSNVSSIDYFLAVACIS
uniref:Uncharacterized protein n=1 Tax=Lepeophtheirus salmonis TaxID=72036 RepID=A0A0K2TU38_LEPSM